MFVVYVTVVIGCSVCVIIIIINDDGLVGRHVPEIAINSIRF